MAGHVSRSSLLPFGCRGFPPATRWPTVTCNPARQTVNPSELRKPSICLEKYLIHLWNRWIDSVGLTIAMFDPYGPQQLLGNHYAGRQVGEGIPRTLLIAAAPPTPSRPRRAVMAPEPPARAFGRPEAASRPQRRGAARGVPTRWRRSAAAAGRSRAHSGHMAGPQRGGTGASWGWGWGCPAGEAAGPGRCASGGVR